MANAGLLTYALPQWMHFFADCESRLRCVCLCRDRFDEVAYCLPHSVHVNLGLSGCAASLSGTAAPFVFADRRFDRPSDTKNASYVYATVLLPLLPLLRSEYRDS